MKPRLDKAAIGVVIGFGGALLCVVLAYLIQVIAQ